jgi:monothiol bacilliredoxin
VVMSNKFLKLSDKETWEQLLRASNEHPVLVFKHSNSCGISSRAYREMEQLDGVNLLEVQTARELSNEVAATTGVEHETPQVILLRNGKAVWNTSHYGVKAGAVSEALRANN